MRAKFLRFGLAGVIGLAVDTGVLYAWLWAFDEYAIGRLVSFLCAVWTTWRINRRYTFQPRAEESLLREWFKYLTAMSGGGLINLAAYSLTMSAAQYNMALPAIAVAIGSMAGMLFNFSAAHFWVYRRRRQ